MGSNLHDSPEEKGQLAVTESSLAADNGIKSTDDIDDRARVCDRVCVHFSFTIFLYLMLVSHCF